MPRAASIRGESTDQVEPIWEPLLDAAGEELVGVLMADWHTLGATTGELAAVSNAVRRARDRLR